MNKKNVHYITPVHIYSQTIKKNQWEMMTKYKVSSIGNMKKKQSQKSSISFNRNSLIYLFIDLLQAFSSQLQVVTSVLWCCSQQKHLSWLQDHRLAIGMYFLTVCGIHWQQLSYKQTIVKKSHIDLQETKYGRHVLTRVPPYCVSSLGGKLIPDSC